MKLQFFGGAQTVTGSQYVLTVNGRSLGLECGLFQGRRAESYEKNLNFRFDPKTLDCLILSHAHMDHSGNIPNLVKKGFGGPIYATPPTVDLCRIMLRDSAHLQLKDIEFVNAKKRKQHDTPLEPLYTMQDAEACMDKFRTVPYRRPFSPIPGVTVTFRDAGHILGSAGMTLEIIENGRTLRFGFSGDIGRPNMAVIQDPDVLRDLDVLMMESTYGNRRHDHSIQVEEELAAVIHDTAATGGKIIIPAFAVGRTQQIVYHLHKLFNEDRIPDMPVYVDSPLACDATEIFRQHPECMDRETNRVFLSGHEDPFGFSRLKYIHDTEASKALNGLTYPHIIISSSGMCEGGRILHHLRNNIENPKNLVLFVGYAAKETLARKLMDGNRVVRIFGMEHAVKCQIKTIDAFSAHADSLELLDYAALTPPAKMRHIILVHGEEDQSLPLRDALMAKGFKNVSYPALQEVITF
ncbi:MAG TPA: MBL fold metallo-hydrolase [Chitinivibrionales bacterium]|nr:MBL fold metallo-hydrolase [Chitinivibrionales bacterium]